MRAIRPIYQHRHQPPRHFDPVLRKIIFRTMINIFGHDSLLTPARLPPGVSLHPFADLPFDPQVGGWLDVWQ